MKAFKNPLDTKERKTIDIIITVPKLTEPIGKSIRAAMKNPVDLSLEMYSSKNPDLLNPLDLTMMSKLDRLRTHNELVRNAREQKRQLDDNLLSSLNKKKEIEKQKQEEEIQSRIKEEAKKLNQNNPK